MPARPYGRATEATLDAATVMPGVKALLGPHGLVSLFSTPCSEVECRVTWRRRRPPDGQARPYGATPRNRSQARREETGDADGRGRARCEDGCRLACPGDPGRAARPACRGGAGRGGQHRRQPRLDRVLPG